jgi:predicted dehydrogenase
MIKGAIIGLGKMGLSHAAIVGAHPEVDLVSVCDSSSLILDAFKKFSKVAVYTDFQKMIDELNLDFVVIATPTKFHYTMVKYALQKGLHVFCEKPFTLTSEQGKELVELSLKQGVVNQVGFHNQFIGTFRELKRLLSINVIGSLVHFTGESYGPVVTKEKGNTWRSNAEEGGGCLNDYASHVINLIQEIIGKPERVHGALLKQIYSIGVEDAVYALLELQNGLTGTLLVNWSDETYRKMSTSLTIQGKKGKIICDATEIKIFLKEPNVAEGLHKGWTIKYITELAIPVDYHLRGEEYSAQIDNFVKCIINKQQSKFNTFEQASNTDLVIEMIVKATKSN